MRILYVFTDSRDACPYTYKSSIFLIDKIFANFFIVVKLTTLAHWGLNKTAGMPITPMRHRLYPIWMQFSRIVEYPNPCGSVFRGSRDTFGQEPAHQIYKARS